MNVQVHKEGNKVKGLTLDVTCGEWLVINTALKMFRMNLNTANEDAIIADDLIETVLGELKEKANG